MGYITASNVHATQKNGMESINVNFEKFSYKTGGMATQLWCHGIPEQLDSFGDRPEQDSCSMTLFVPLSKSPSWRRIAQCLALRGRGTILVTHRRRGKRRCGLPSWSCVTENVRYPVWLIFSVRLKGQLRYLKVNMHNKCSEADIIRSPDLRPYILPRHEADRCERRLRKMLHFWRHPAPRQRV